LLKDKLHYLVDRLYLGVVVMKYEWTDFIPIHSQILADLLGTRDAPRVKKMLLQLGIIEVEKKHGGETYEPGECSKRYRFSKRYRDCDFHSVPIEDYRFIELLEQKRAKRCKRIVGEDAVRELIARSIQNIDYDVDAAQEFLEQTSFDNANSENAYRYAVQCIKDKDWLFAHDPQGRLYHNWSQMARKLRCFASYKGKSLFAADVSACQPCLLSLLYEGDCEEKHHYVEIVKNNKFYEFLNDHLQKPCDLSDEGAKGDFKKEVFHQIFYGSNWAKPTALNQIFMSEFPILAGLVRKAKHRRHRDLPVRLQKIEADVVIEEVAVELAKLHSGEEFCLITVHDCLVTTKKYVEECAERLRIAFKNRLGFAPTVKVKAITDPAILDQADVFIREFGQWNDPETDDALEAP